MDKKRVCKAAALLCGLALCGAAVYLLRPPCLILQHTGLYCAGCGTPAEKARAQAPAAPTPTHAAGPACASCGAPLGAGDMFCMSCGAKVAAPAVSAGAGVGASELVAATGDGSVTATPGGESAPKGGE